MQVSKIYRLAIVVSLSCAIAGCQTPSAPPTNGSGYQKTTFKDPRAALLASQDEFAGPAINSNNRQCDKDKACRK